MTTKKRDRKKEKLDQFNKGLPERIENMTEDELRAELKSLMRGRAWNRKQISFELVDYLCEKQCTVTEIAAALGVAKETLNNRCLETFGISSSQYIEMKREIGKVSLRGAQWEIAVEKKDPGMLKWLGKQYLDQKDQIDNTHRFPAPTVIEKRDGTQIILGSEENIDPNQTEGEGE